MKNNVEKIKAEKNSVGVGESGNHYDLKVSAQKQNQAPSFFQNFIFIFRFAERLTAIVLRRDFSIHRSAAAITDRAVCNELTKICAPLLLCPIKLT